MPDLPYSVRISITCGPIEPECTGKSSVLPSGSLSVAVLSLAFFSMISSSAGAQALHRRAIPLVNRVAATAHIVPNVVVGQVEQLRQRVVLRMLREVPVQDDIELEQPAPAFPEQPVFF